MDDDFQREPVGEWAERAACRGMTALFFPHRHDQNAVRKAKKICDSCCVRSDCLDHALRNPERYGMRAGMGVKALHKERQRRGITYRTRQEVTHGTRSSYIKGCRCDDCRTAQQTYQRKWRETR
jgi:WhiB family redox-sensing transcriptional regulator